MAQNGSVPLFLLSSKNHPTSCLDFQDSNWFKSENNLSGDILPDKGAKELHAKGSSSSS